MIYLFIVSTLEAGELVSSPLSSGVPISILGLNREGTQVRDKKFAQLAVLVKLLSG